MTLLTVDLPEPLARFVDEQVSAGAYKDAGALVRGAVERLKVEAENGDLDRSATLLQVGMDEVERGEAVEVTDVKSWLNGLGRGPGADEAA